MRVCFFGDSFVNGTGDDDGLGWVGRVVASARREGRDLTAYNLGIRRDTSADVRGRWQDEASRRLPAAHDGRLVFSFGANDCVAIDGRPRVAPDESRANAEAILREARALWPTLMIGPATLADAPEANARIGALSAAYAETCAALGVPYLEVCGLTSGWPCWTEEALAGDGAHPSRGGYALLAEAVAGWAAWRGWLAGR